MNAKPEIEFRSATQTELSTILEWAAQEGWNPGLEDAAAFFASDPSGYFVAATEKELAAAISIVKHSEDFAFLGLYICRPEFRGRGIGLDLWSHAMKTVGGRTVGLDGVPDQQENYEASGFERVGQTSRYGGTVAPIVDDNIRPVQTDDLGWIAALDRRATGVDRPAFLEAWHSDSETRRTLVDTDQNGFVTVRRCVAGLKVGPLTTKDECTARRLLHHAASVFPGVPLTIDIGDAQPQLADYCLSLGLTPAFNTARMYRGTPPNVDTDIIHAVATLELG